jgi:D-alanyl-D-alanine dipeptidase
MRIGLLSFIAAFLASASAQAQNDVPVRQLLAVSQQMVVVTAVDWNSTTGWLRRYERNDQTWQITGPAFPVVLGSNGLGWGRGLHPFPQPGPEKREGDGRSPAGIFMLNYAFGYAAPDSVREIKLPYVQCASTVECVDDTNSTYYNTITDRKSVTAPDWKSSEKMRLSDDRYRLGVFVGHNTGPAVPGAGSCIFLHIWKGSEIPTSGCTAMSDGAMESLLGWLDPQAHPILVQLPESEYARYQSDWLLPSMDVGNPPRANVSK